MRRGPARLAYLLGALLTLSLGASAQARTDPRIVNGSPASQGEYPAQGVLFRNGGFICGGTLVSNRYFLTAAHCVTNLTTGAELPTNTFSVRLGNVNRDDGALFTFSDKEVNADYDFEQFDNDSALFELSTPVPPAVAEPIRVIEAGEIGLWAPGQQSTLIGWGDTTNGGSPSDVLLEANAPMRSDADCATAYDEDGPGPDPSDFHSDTMVCAGIGSADTCQGDSGGPLMVSDGSFLVLAGLTSWGGPCNSATQPGVYTRLGAPALNTWVRDRVPMADATVSDATPDTGQAVELSVTATNPGLPAFTNFAWDFESDGVTDAIGANATHSYPAAGSLIARVTATGAGLDTAVAKVALNVAQAPAPVVTATPGPIATAPPPTTEPVPRTRLATILTLNRPQVRRGRFKMRINFAKTAPAGNAFVEVFRGKKKIGSARARVRRGGSRQVSVKLTKAGRKLLRRSERKRLRVKVQVRVKRQILGSKRLTIRL